MTKDTTYFCTVCNTNYAELPDDGIGENTCGRCLTTGFFQRRIAASREHLIDEARSHVVQIQQRLEYYEREYVIACKRLEYLESDQYLENPADYYLPDGDDYFATKQLNIVPTEADSIEPSQYEPTEDYNYANAYHETIEPGNYALTEGNEFVPIFIYEGDDIEIAVPDFENR